ncbi:MAG: hypothetical protein KDJ36_15615 [Hyphomicrobiaceae bacterium]|nr:hypothetical protein [Hyphomicrobiaceae bacterium]
MFIRSLATAFFMLTGAQIAAAHGDLIPHSHPHQAPPDTSGLALLAIALLGIAIVAIYRQLPAKRAKKTDDRRGRR